MTKYLLPFIVFLSFIGCTAQQPIEKPKIKEYKTAKPIETPQIIEEPIIEETIEAIVEEEVINDTFKVALIFPSKFMSKYGVGASKVVSAYLVQQNINIDMQIFDCYDQDYNNLAAVFNEIKEQNISNVIGLFTSNMVNHLATIQELETLNIYIPTINKKSTNIAMDNVVFGGIDYEQQIDKLLTLGKGSVVNFHSKRGISKKLTTILNNKNERVSNKPIATDTNYGSVLNNSLKYKTMFLNTTMVKSSILLSQIRGKDLRPYRILSTQLNYNPLIISLTQSKDRSKLIFANSIGDIDPLLEHNITLLGADIQYDWVNYSTLIGVDYLLKKTVRVVDLLSYTIDQGQVQYDVHIVKNEGYRFKSYLPVVN
ncbi:MAG: hypothetical protein U9N30_09760 [Campylobacterota bacterium]|nr:hypothetical protein [Campylobacterota bacterium]